MAFSDGPAAERIDRVDSPVSTELRTMVPGWMKVDLSYPVATAAIQGAPIDTTHNGARFQWDNPLAHTSTYCDCYILAHPLFKPHLHGVPAPVLKQRLLCISCRWQGLACIHLNDDCCWPGPRRKSPPVQATLNSSRGWPQSTCTLTRTSTPTLFVLRTHLYPS